jgi:hypothetical protein
MVKFSDSGVRVFYYLIVPVIRRLLRIDAVSLRLVEEVDERLVRVEDPLPFVAVEFALEVDHGAEGGAAFELGGHPRVPVGNRGEGAVEGDAVQFSGEVLRVGVVPEEGSLLDGHCGGGLRVNLGRVRRLWYEMFGEVYCALSMI